MKTKRLLAFLLIAVFVIGVMPLAVAADGGTLDCDREHTHTDDCYELDCELGEHTHSSGQNSTCTREWCSYESNPDHYIGRQHKQGLRGSKREGNGRYKCCTKAEHTHSEIGGSCYIRICNYEKEHEHGPECYEYEYTITVKFVLVAGGEPVVPATTLSGTIRGNEEIDTLPGTVSAPGGYEFAEGESGSRTVTVNVQNLQHEVEFLVVRVEETPNTETPVYIPPQVVIPATPTPEPEIELPEEEIPTTVPDETEIEEEEFEEEEFEDEEIPTDVPETGDSSPIYTAFALIALAGAAFALTLKRSRNIG